jgi:hypothetical protein
MDVTASPKRLARIAGVLYLIVFVFGVFGEKLVRATVYVQGDAVATAQSVVAHATLVRIGVVADLLMATAFLFLGMALYLLLKRVNRNAAGVMVTLVAIGSGIICLNMVFQFGALLVAIDHGSYAVAFGAAGSNALVLLLLDIHHYGYLITQIFTGLWLVPLGYLAFKSGMFPRALGILLVVAGVCDVADMLALLLAPGFGAAIDAFVLVPGAVAELWMLGYLLVRGVRSTSDRARARRGSVRGGVTMTKEAGA